MPWKVPRIRSTFSDSGAAWMTPASGALIAQLGPPDWPTRSVLGVTAAIEKFLPFLTSKPVCRLIVNFETKPADNLFCARAKAYKRTKLQAAEFPPCSFADKNMRLDRFILLF